LWKLWKKRKRVIYLCDKYELFLSLVVNAYKCLIFMQVKHAST